MVKKKELPTIGRLIEILESVMDENYQLGPIDRDDLVLILGIVVDEVRAAEAAREKFTV